MISSAIKNDEVFIHELHEFSRITIIYDFFKINSLDSFVSIRVNLCN